MADPSRPVPSYQYSNPTKQALGTEIVGKGDGYGGNWISRFMPNDAELARLGYLFALSSGVVANAKIPIVDIPTTTASWALYNGNALGSGICLFVKKVGVHLASGTSGVGGTIWAGLSGVAQSGAGIPTAATGTVGPQVLNTNSANRVSKALIGGAVTLAAAPAWHPIGDFLNHAAVATVGSGKVIEMEGGIVIPPNFACGFEIISGTGTTAKYAFSFTYAEMPADIGSGVA